MAVTVISRPQGHKLNSSMISATIASSGGDAAIYVPGGHSLMDGDYVYIESDYDSYNGFKYVDSVAYDHFKIRNSESGSNILFKQNASISYFVSVLEHGFQSVHLPIVYELNSDLWPVNIDAEAYTPITIVSQESVNGYTCLNLSTGLTNPIALEYITLVGSGSLAGPYQILSVISNWKIVINLAYSASNDFSIYQVEKYYNNYFIKVNVYAGLPYGHRWEEEKPYVLAGTIPLIPDSDGNMKFSVAEILQGFIRMGNNLNLDSLPNNIDFMVAFYIDFSEYYDISDGNAVTSTQISTTLDSFEGYAINSQMAFKNVGSGFMDDYLDSDSILSRWLTQIDVPQAYVNRYFDISFLNQYEGIDVIITIYKILNGVVLITEYLNYDDPGKGLLRVGFVPDSAYDQYCIKASASSIPGIPESTTSVTLPALSSGVNIAGSGIDWATGASPNVSLPWLASDAGVTKLSDIWAENFAFISGNSYSISVTWSGTNILALNITITFYIYILDSSNNILNSYSVDVTTGASRTDTITFIANPSCVKYACKVKGVKSAPTFGSDFTSVITISSITAMMTTPEIPAIPAHDITETICIDIIDECDSTFTNDDLRITEGGNLRELE